MGLLYDSIEWALVVTRAIYYVEYLSKFHKEVNVYYIYIYI